MFLTREVFKRGRGYRDYFRKPRKFLENASRHTENRIAATTTHLKFRVTKGAEDTTALYQYHQQKPEWLTDIRAQNMGYKGLHKRVDRRHNCATPLWGTTGRKWSNEDVDLRRIRKILPAGREAYIKQAPQAACWYSDEDTFELGQKWDEWEEKMVALRAYLKEDILNKQKSLISNDSNAENRFETPENLKRRLQFNTNWNDTNEQIRDEVFSTMDSIRQQQQKRAEKEALDKQARADIKHGKKLRDFIMANRKEPAELDKKIDNAIDEPVLYNFSVNADGSIHSRHVPAMSNLDSEFEKQQEAMIADMRKARMDRLELEQKKDKKPELEDKKDK